MVVIDIIAALVTIDFVSASTHDSGEQVEVCLELRIELPGRNYNNGYCTVAGQMFGLGWNELSLEKSCVLLKKLLQQ